MLLMTLPVFAVPCAAANLLTNAGFEEGMADWTGQHGWYEQPEGAGLSEVTVAEGEGRDETAALKITGASNRGLAMQVRSAYPGRYRATGWIRCQDLGDAEAVILAEWLGRENEWLRGDRVGGVKGTQEWQRFEADLEPPPDTRSVHLDLLTTSANEGMAWFDDMAFERILSDLPPPDPPTLTAETPEGREGCLQVTWDPDELGESVVRLLVYCAQMGAGRAADTMPKVVADPHSRECMLRSLQNGRSYEVTAVAVDADGRRSDVSPTVRAAVADRQAPRGGWLDVTAIGDGRVQVGWSPHLLDDDLVRVHMDGIRENVA